MKSRDVLFLLMILLISASGCKYQSESNEISQNSDISFDLIFQSDSMMVLNGKRTSLDSFDSDLQILVDGLSELNLKNANVSVSIHANKDIDMGSIADIQLKLRNIGIRRLAYHTL